MKVKENKKADTPEKMPKQSVENVLVLQGGGSLGAFACGVMKAFAKKISNSILIQVLR